MDLNAQDRRLSSVTVGQSIPELSRGPMTPVHLMRWSAAIENWHRIHYDRPFAMDHEKLPDLLINGSWKQHFMVQALRRWAEPEGWLLHVSFEFRKMDLAGSVLHAWATVTDITVRDGLGYVELETGIRNQDGQQSTPGQATVVFPGDAAVPYPFPLSS